MKPSYTQKTLEEAIKLSLSKASVLRHLGLVPSGGNYKTLTKYIRLWGISIDHFTGSAWNQGDRYRPICTPIPLLDILVENSTYTSTNGLKRKLFKEGYKERICERCTLKYWLDRPIPLELHHINGVSSDNRIENLQILCPNCHALTDNYRGKNIQPTMNVPEVTLSTSKHKGRGGVTKSKNKKTKKRNNTCLVCSEPAVNKYCSYKCSRFVRSKSIPSKDTLVSDKKKYKTYVAISHKYNVSDQAVRKWFKKYNLI